MTAVLPTETPVAAVAPSDTCAAGGDEAMHVCVS